MKILTKKCIVCGKEFTKSVNESIKNWKNRHKFCSKSCQARFLYKQKLKKYQFTKERHYIPPTAFKKRQRPSPKTEFKNGHQPWNKGKNWPKKDRWKFSRWAGVYGKNTPNWRGGTTKLRIAIMALKKYKEWRMKVFKRDKFVCRKCGRKRKKGDRVVLEVHHEKPVSQIIKENKIKTTEDAVKCKELWMVKKGKTLCILCHKQTFSYLKNGILNATA